MRPVTRLREGTRCLPKFSRTRVSGLALLAASAGVAASLHAVQVRAHDGNHSSGAAHDSRASVAEFMVPDLKPGAYRIIIRPVAPDAASEPDFAPRRELPLARRRQGKAAEPTVSLRVPEITFRVPAISLRMDELKDGEVRLSPVFSVRVPAQPVTPSTPEFEEPQPVFEARFEDDDDAFSSRSLRQVANERTTRERSRLRLNSDRADLDDDRRGETAAERDAKPSFDDEDLPLVRMKAPLASVRVETDAPSTGSAATARPSFDDEAFERADRLPEVRMRAPLASVRVEREDADRRADAPRPTFDAPSFDAAQDDTLPQVRIKAPLASVRVEDDAPEREASPEFTVRPEFGVETDAPRERRRPAFETDEGFGDDAAVIDPAQRTLPREESNETADAGASATRPSFEDDAFAPRSRRADDDRDRAERDVSEAPETRAPEFAEPEFAPEFAEQRAIEPRRADERDFSGERDVAERPSEPAFDDADDSRRNESRVTRLPRTPAPVNRSDDFRSDPVGVAAAIARNRARYGASVQSDDDFFKLRGRY
ncbi:MAG: hypothetical protein AAGJ70_04685, partial [Pseudomonadota bacterium]